MKKLIEYITYIPKMIMKAYDDAVEAGAVYDPARLEYIKQKATKEPLKQSGLEAKLV
jgi:hypothetical protein